MNQLRAITSNQRIEMVYSQKCSNSSPPQMTTSLVQKYTIAEEDMNQRSISLNINDTLRLNENELTKNWKIENIKK